MKKTVSLFLTLVLLFSLSGTVVYAEGETESSTLPNLTGGVVTGFYYERTFRFLENTLKNYNKDDLTELYDMLADVEDLLECTVKLPGGEETTAMCSASWNTAAIPLDVAGRYEIIVTLTSPEACTIGEGVRTQIRLPVQILDADAPIKLVSIAEWNPYTLAVAVPQSGSVEDITENPLFQDYTTEVLRCEDENGNSYNADIFWDFSPLDLDKPGLYTLIGTPVPPEGTVFAEELTLPQPTAAISVQAEEKPDINCFYMLYPDIRFPFIPPSSGSNEVTVWLSENAGTWRELTAIGKAGLGENEIWVNSSIFTKGNDYRVQVDYKGGQTGILSFSWDDTIVIDSYWEGDRDGGDSDGSKPPNITQPPPKPDGGAGENGNGSDAGDGNTVPPAPTPNPTPTPTPGSPSPTAPEANPTSSNGSGEQSVTSSSAPPQHTEGNTPQSDETDSSDFLEHSDETSTTISGLRLRLMRKDGSVPFSKQGVNLVLSKEAIDTLSLSDDSVFTIEIQRESETEFSFAVSVDSINITELAGTKVTLPYTPSNQESTLSVRHSKLKTEIFGNYEPKQQLASFELDTSGQYTILEEAVSAAVNHSSSEQPKQTANAGFPILPICLTAGALLLSGGVFFLKRRSAK